jgi:exodeoxyribonuclease VII large subunit
LLVAHAAVQGQGAAEEVARGIRALEARGVDVVVVCRGGGSVEDLWAFNERALLEAVWNCSKPVVSGVGHEIDTTLCDLVADLRAHTPTDAAEKVFPDRAALEERIESVDIDLGRAMDALLAEAEARLDQLATRPCLSSPRWFLDERAARLGRAATGLVERMAGLVLRAEARLESAARRVERRSPRVELEQRAARLQLLAARLVAAPQARLERVSNRLDSSARTLEAVSPLSVLRRGYSITFVEGASKPLVDAADAPPGATLVTRLADGELRSRVEGGS